jgi:hypothetical protein
VLSVSDWPIITIGPGGLLFTSSPIYPLSECQLYVWVGLRKSTKLNLDVKNIFRGSHTEHWWRCSNTFIVAWSWYWAWGRNKPGLRPHLSLVVNSIATNGQYLTLILHGALVGVVSLGLKLVTIFFFLPIPPENWNWDQKMMKMFWT